MASSLLVVVGLGILPAGAYAEDDRQEGPIAIDKCQTISQPGSYKLVNNLTFKGSSGACLMITASGVTIDLVGFTISGPGTQSNTTMGTVGILASGDLSGIAVQNGSISGFQSGVDLCALTIPTFPACSATGSLVEKVRVYNILGGLPFSAGISASGIVRSNAAFGTLGAPAAGIIATGTVTGNYVTRFESGMGIRQGSTVIGNTATDNRLFGFVVECPSNVTDNTAINNRGNLSLAISPPQGDCITTNNVAP
jgi:hypothetical protein